MNSHAHAHTHTHAQTHTHKHTDILPGFNKYMCACSFVLTLSVSAHQLVGCSEAEVVVFQTCMLTFSGQPPPDLQLSHQMLSIK